MAISNARSPSVWSAIRRLLGIAGRHKVWLYAAVTCDLLRSAGNIVGCYFLARFLDAAAAANSRDFVRYLLMFLGLHVLYIPLEFLRTWSIGLFSERTSSELRSRIATQAVSLPVEYLESRHSGDILSLFNADLARLGALTGNDLLQAIGQSLRAIGALAYLLVISWQLTLVATVLTPIVFLALSKVSGLVSRRTNEIQTALGAANAVAQDGLASPMVAKSFNLAGIMSARFRRANDQVLNKGLHIARLRAMVEGASDVVQITPFLITFAYGGYLVVTGHLTFGFLLAFINLLNHVTNPLRNLPPTLASISEAAGAAQRAYALLDEGVERTGGAPAAPPQVAQSVVRSQNLTFAYASAGGPSAGRPALEGVSLEVAQGEVVALVGPSGGGKSTLLKVLLGFYPVPDKQLFLFGRDLNDWQLPAAREQMAFVAQDTYLFPVSIRENILCAQPGASDEQIERAARAANLHDFIASLPDGYDTLVGERGARLSGGERQRLALARAVLKDAPILLLDEPTSALDAESEAVVQEALDRFMVGRTTIAIAHRLATIRHADRILVIDAGKVVEQGTHEGLMASGRLYQELYRRQFAESAAPEEASPTRSAQNA